MSRSKIAIQGMHAHPVRTGVFAVLGIIILGSIAGFMLGFGTPLSASAQAIIVTAPPPPPPLPPPPPPAPAPLPPPPPKTAPISGTHSGGDNTSDPIIVTGTNPSNPAPPTIAAPAPAPDPLPPCCTQSTPPTPPSIGSLPPCCTVVTPPALPPVDILPPCCTVITPTPPPIVTTPPPPSIPPPIIIPPPVIPPPPISPPPPTIPTSGCIALTADKSTISSGESVTLTWKVKNDKPVTITDVTHNTTVATSNDQTGTVTVHPTTETTYHASVPSDTHNSNCTVKVKMAPPTSSGSSCVYLSEDKTTITSGEAVTLTWKVNNASHVTITNVTTNTQVKDSTDQTGSVVVNPIEATTYHASVPGDENNSYCTVSVNLTTPGGGGGGGSSGGGGGGGGSSHHVYFNSTTRNAPPLGSVYLSQIPYTGLDLGPVGTVLYWAMLVLWSLAATYLILFGLLPFLKRKLMVFGASVGTALNAEPAGLLPAYAGAATLSAASVPAASSYESSAARAQVMERSAPAPAPIRTAPPRMEMTGDSFKKFAAGGALTIDDIVKGLSRESGMELSTEPQEPQQNEPQSSTAAYAPVHQDPAPAAIERKTPPSAPVRPAAPARAERAAAAETHPDIIAFIEQILEGERDAVFSTIRHLTQAGHDAEAFVSHAILALDDAYKARLDGTPVHEDVKAVTDHCATSFLEKLVTALTTAVDGSYSMGVTGIKLALTRALAVSQG